MEQRRAQLWRGVGLSDFRALDGLEMHLESIACLVRIFGICPVGFSRPHFCSVSLVFGVVSDLRVKMTLCLSYKDISVCQLQWTASR